ncbi:YcaO-like family protein [Roseomonas gilardii subsp. gilardii]|uniref:YcaO-like family protein n=1 Tax=Roseomonas gilardii TaxID=257708 RepID=UPI001FFA4F01|nr:YcaO-like family protein [Roseomonas gilardii]UPG73907.1 YcaO-like family protein [Roseomonas gilardii subsp. gilardii]
MTGLPPGLPPEDGAKRFRLGAHRVCDPGDTLERALRHAERFGLTRVAVLTGLDVTGIPVAAAVRPNARSLSVFQGKGATLAAAKASAVMEAAEAWHAETHAAPLRWGSHDGLREGGLRLLDPARLPRSAGAAPDLLPCAVPMLWVEGRDLADGMPLWVPLDLVTADYALDGPPSGGFLQATTNGLASGNTRAEALVHALAELVERDAHALWLARPPEARAETAIDPASIADPLCADFLARFAAAGIALAIWDITSGLGIPAFRVLALPGREEPGVEAELGLGCHPDPGVALSRALAEAAQARVTRISGARDDFAPESYAAPARAARRAAARRAMAEAAMPRRRFGEVQGCAAPGIGADLALLLSRIGAAGLGPVAWVDLTREEIGIPVVRAVVAGLEGTPGPAGGGYAPGARARAVGRT